MTIREEINDWLLENLSGEYEKVRWRGCPGDEDAYPELRKQWEQSLAKQALSACHGQKSMVAAI